MHGGAHHHHPDEQGDHGSGAAKPHGPLTQLGAYGELVWPAIAGIALLVGYFAAKGGAQNAGYALYAIAYFVGGWEATRDGVKQLLHRRLDIDFLMVVAAIGAALVCWVASKLDVETTTYIAIIAFAYITAGIMWLALAKGEGATVPVAAQPAQ